jgi:hypothetical protein
MENIKTHLELDEQQINQTFSHNIDTSSPNWNNHKFITEDSYHSHDYLLFLINIIKMLLFLNAYMIKELSYIKSF